MTDSKPKRPILHVAEQPETPRCRLGDHTWEERREMTAAQLVVLMGPAHRYHADAKNYPRRIPLPLVPLKNCARKCKEWEPEQDSFLSIMKQLLRWMLR